MLRPKPKDHYDRLVKLLMLGDSSVGKSSLLMRFCENTFVSSFALTIGVDFKTKVVIWNKKRVKLQLWDTAGQERFRTITPAYFRSAMGVVLVYDVSSLETFYNLRRWMKNVDDYADQGIQRILVGNKVDLELNRRVTTQQGKDLAAEYHIPFFETSAKLNISVQPAFMLITELVCVARYPEDEDGYDAFDSEETFDLYNIEDTQNQDIPMKRKCCLGGS